MTRPNNTLLLGTGSRFKLLGLAVLTVLAIPFVAAAVHVWSLGGARRPRAVRIARAGG